MSLEPSEAIEVLRGDLAGVEYRLTARIETEASERRSDIRELRVETRELRAELGELRVEMREMRAELMRHMHVLFKSVRDDIRLVAEGLAVVTAKLDSFNR